MTNRTLACSLLFALALTPLAAQPEPGKEELKLKLPKPMFIGTPTNIKSANLGPITGKPRPPFFVPKGTVLLSAKKPVTSSDMQPVIGELDMVTDGEKAGSDGYFIELGPGHSGSRSISAPRTRSPPSSRGTTTARRASTATSSSRFPTTRRSKRA